MSRHLLQTHTCDSPLNIALILISRYCRHSTTFATESGGLFYNISSLILSTSLPTSNTSSVPRHAATTTTSTSLRLRGRHCCPTQNGVVPAPNPITFVLPSPTSDTTTNNQICHMPPSPSRSKQT